MGEEVTDLSNFTTNQKVVTTLRDLNKASFHLCHGCGSLRYLALPPAPPPQSPQLPLDAMGAARRGTRRYPCTPILVLLSSPWMPLSMIFTVIWPSDTSGRRKGGLMTIVFSFFGLPKYLSVKSERAFIQPFRSIYQLPTLRKALLQIEESSPSSQGKTSIELISSIL